MCTALLPLSQQLPPPLLMSQQALSE